MSPKIVGFLDENVRICRVAHSVLEDSPKSGMQINSHEFETVQENE